MLSTAWVGENVVKITNLPPIYHEMSNSPPPSQELDILTENFALKPSPSLPSSLEHWTFLTSDSVTSTDTHPKIFNIAETSLWTGRLLS